MNAIKNNALLAAALSGLLPALAQNNASAQTLTAPLTLTGTYNSSFTDSGSSFGPSFTSQGTVYGWLPFVGTFIIASWDDTLALTFTPIADVSGNSLSISCPGTVDLTLANCDNPATVEFVPNNPGTIQMDPTVQLGLTMALTWNGSGPSGTLKDPSSYSFQKGPLNFDCYGFTPNGVTLSDEQSQTLYSENVLGDIAAAFGIDIPDWLASFDLNVDACITVNQTVSCLGISSSAGTEVSCEQPLSVFPSACAYSLCNISAQWADTFTVDEGLGVSVSFSLLDGLFNWTSASLCSGPLLDQSTTFVVSSAPVACVDFTFPEYQVGIEQVPGGTVIPVSQSTPNCVPPPANMVLWLPFDETNGTVSANLASPANGGTWVGNPTPVSGVYVDNSLSFNGNGQYVTVPDYSAIDIGTSDFTIDAWVNRPTTSGTGVQTIVDKRSQIGVVGAKYYGYSFALYANKLLLQLADGPYNNYGDTAIVPADGQWHLVAVTVSRTSSAGGQFYVDGQPTGTFNPTTHQGSLANTSPLEVGNSSVSATYWLGGIDEVEVFNRALAVEDIQRMFHAGTFGKCKANGTATVCEGQCATFRAVADSGYFLCGWYVNGMRQRIVGIGGLAAWLGGTFTVSGIQANETVTAEFCPIPCPTCPPAIISGTGPVQTSAFSGALVGTFNPNGNGGVVYVEYGPMSGFDNTTVPVAFASGTTNVTFTNTLTGLLPNTTYQYNLIVSNANGYADAGGQTFTTRAVAPTVSTSSVVFVSATSVLLNGSVNPEGSPVTVWFNYGTTTNYGSATTNPPIALLNDTSNDAVQALLTNLAPAATYHFQLIASNNVGVASTPDQVFATPGAAPAIASVVPTNISAVVASLQGSVNPNGLDTAAWIKWGTSTGYGNTTPSVICGNGSTNIGVFFVLTNLTAGTLYHVELVATNAAGMAQAPDVVFTTSPPLPPVVATVGYSAFVLTNQPMAYWQFNDTQNPATGTAVVLDSSTNGLNGLYATNAQNGFNGVAGPQPPDFPGFPTNNWAMQTTVNTPGSWASVPLGNLGLDAVTFTAWVYADGPQADWAGLLMDRSGSDQGGVGMGGSNEKSAGMLAYTWNTNSTWTFMSGLTIPTNQWSFVAVAIAPTEAILYLAYVTNGIATFVSATNAMAEAADAFGTGPWNIGSDQSSVTDGIRTFNGSIDHVAVFGRTLSGSDIAALFATGLGIQTFVAPACCGTWSLAATNGPSARAGNVMAYDSARGVVELFGGSDSSSYKGDTWEWNGAAWTLKATTGPSPRDGTAMVYDSHRGVAVLFGGAQGNSNLQSDTWEWNGTAWTQKSTTGPSARFRHTMAFDSVRGVTVLFGGVDTSGPGGSFVAKGDTWEWDGTAWTSFGTTGPSARESSAMAYDSARQKIVLFGGDNGSPRLGDTWERTGTTWAQVFASGPSARSGHAMVYAGSCGTVLFGGYDNTVGSKNDTWGWDGTQWIQLASSGPSARSGHGMAYDGNRAQVVLFGGSTINGVNGETWETVQCASKCLTVTCPTAKTVQAGSNWTFDLPVASSCCGSNVTVAVTGAATNGVANITFTGGGTAATGEVAFAGNTAISGYLDITAGTNAGSYTLSPGAGTNTLFAWDGLILPASNPFLDSNGLLFTNGGLEINFWGNGPGSYSLLGAPPKYGPNVTNGVATIAVSSQTVTRTWLLTDACGNSNTCNQTVTVANNTPPVLTCAGNKTAQYGTAWSFDAPTASGGCGGSNVAVTVAGTVTNGVCSQFITQTWLATDACGNRSTCSQTVAIVNTNPPVLLSADDKTAQCAASWTFDVPVAIDASGSTNVTVTVLSTLTNGAGCSQVITRTWQATDCYGNTATSSQTVTLTDAEPPLITQQPQSQTLASGGNASFSVTATGAQPLNYSWYFNGVQMPSSPSNLLSVSSAQIANAGNYWAVIQNAGGAVTSQVAHLSILPQAPPSGLSLSITNSQGTLVVDVWDDGTIGFAWQLQSTTDLLGANWVVETNGAGNAQFVVSTPVRAKFFRAARLMPPSESAQLQTTYGGLLPNAQFNTGLLMAPLGPWDQDVLNADGTLLDINSPIPPSRMLSGSDFLTAYNTIRLDSLSGNPALPDLNAVMVSINPNAQPVTLEQNLAFQGIYPLALTLVPYNTIDTNAFADGRLALVDSNNVPLDLSNTNLQINAPVFVVAGANPASYAVTNIFAGTGLLRTVLQFGSEPVKFMLPKEYLVAPGIVDSLQIRFPGVPLIFTNGSTNYLDDGFVDIVPDQVFFWDFSNVNVDTNGEAVIPFVMRVAGGGKTNDAAGRLAIHLELPMPYYCQSTEPQYFYPAIRPWWWPSGGYPGSDWSTKPANPQTFFTGAKPSWWPRNIPWPCVYGSYVYGYPFFGLRVESFGILTIPHDPQAWGPLWDSTSGHQGLSFGPQGGNIWAGGYNLRLYPATYRSSDPTSCRCKALNLVLLVDGIDTWANYVPRTQAEIWADFGYEGQKLLDKGYDLLVLNYVNGDDYIQRNAYALLTVLQDYVPGYYMAPGHEQDRVAIVAASMGTQVTRYAMLTAEKPPAQDDHIGLAIYLDGPFLGANIPWASQRLLQFLANNYIKPSSDAHIKYTKVLESSAANQLLRAAIDYAPNGAYNDFYNEMAAFPFPGLPQNARNVAVSSGSGSGLQQVIPTGPADTFTPETLAFVSTKPTLDPSTTRNVLNLVNISEWGEFNVDAQTERPSGSSNPYLSAAIQGGITSQWFWQSQPSFSIPLTWDITSSYIDYGSRPSDLSPGGFTALGGTIRDGYNSASGHLGTMSGYDPCNTTFIPVFSALYVRSAEKTNEQIQAEAPRSWFYVNLQGIYSSINYGAITPVYQSTRTYADFWYGPENNARHAIDPNTPVLSPFDAIWYQAANNIEHVFNLGNLPPPGYEAFVFNELDQFTANEPFTSESVLSNQPKMPLHEEYLAGDMLNLNPTSDQLLTINTMTRNAMVQSFDGTSWMDLWDNIPGRRADGTAGWIGAWPINKGDKFFLARLQKGGPKLLVSFSASTPSWGMVQMLVGTTWTDIWDNFGSGQFGSGLIPIRPTNLYAFGDPEGLGFDKLLVAYPYVCSDGLEKTFPGTSGLSQASLLQFSTSSGWTETWNNKSKSHFVGEAPIRFGDRLMFGRLATDPLNNPSGANNSLFSVNLLRDIFGGPTVVQDFKNPTWSLIWTDGGQTSLQCSGCNGNIGCWHLGGARDSFYFADLLGDGIDELICANDLYWHAYNYVGQPGGWWCLDSGFADPNVNHSILGNCYQLSPGDRFVFGHFDANRRGDLVLSLNPLPHGTFRGPAVLQQRTSNGWAPTVWASTTTLTPYAISTGPPMLGSWQLYQDLPCP